MLTSIPYPLKTNEVIITKIFFINCLPDEDVGIFNRCYEDITTNILDKTIYKDYYERIDCQSAAQFLNALDKIYEEVNRYRLCHAVKTENIMQAVLPFIQIEAHGSEESIQMANGETVAGETFYEKLLKINIASENNTIILSNTCFGIKHILSAIGCEKAYQNGIVTKAVSPVYAALGPDKKINSADISDNLYQLFQSIFQEKLILKAMDQYRHDIKMKFYYCGSEWKTLIKSVIYDHFYPYRKHKEELLTYINRDNSPLHSISISKKRKSLRKIYPQLLQNIFEEIERTFLIGKRSIYTLEDILKELDEENKK